MASLTLNETLADRLVANRSSWLRNAALTIGGSLLLWASAKVQAPFYPVPITMQTFVVLALGMAFGWRLAAATVGLYLLQGAAGLPVFAGTPERGIGVAYLVGPTGGYLLGYLAAATLVGWLAERGWDKRMVTTALAMLAGNTVIYALGVLWLGSIIGWDKPVLQFGLYPFIPGDILKIALATLALPLTWRLIERRG